MTALAAGLVVVTGLILWKMLNRPEYQQVMRYPWRRRMRVSKALRRRNPISPDDVPVADAIVGAMRNQQWIFWLQPVLIASWILSALNRHGPVRWLSAGFALVLALAWLYTLRMQRRVIRQWNARSNWPARGRQDTVD